MAHILKPHWFLCLKPSHVGTWNLSALDSENQTRKYPSSPAAVNMQRPSWSNAWFRDGGLSLNLELQLEG